MRGDTDADVDVLGVLSCGTEEYHGSNWPKLHQEKTFKQCVSIYTWNWEIIMLLLVFFLVSI